MENIADTVKCPLEKGGFLIQVTTYTGLAVPGRVKYVKCTIHHFHQKISNNKNTTSDNKPKAKRKIQVVRT